MKLPTHVGKESIASFLSRVPKQRDASKQALLEKLLEALTATPPSICYYCSKKNFQSKEQYQTHVVTSHNGKLAYPDAKYIEAKGLKRQGCLWEQ